MTTPNFDNLRERIRERVTEPRDDESDLDTICGNCQGMLTRTDRDAGYCTQCKSSIESDDEDLNGWELGYDD